MPKAPEPAKRSSTRAPSIVGPTRLKIASLTIPWVGRIPFGDFRRRPRASPPETRSLDIRLHAKAVPPGHVKAWPTSPQSREGYSPDLTRIDPRPLMVPILTAG